MQTQTVFKAGNSDVISIPAELKKKTGIKAGTNVILQISPDGKTIMVSHANDTKNSNITPEFMSWLNDINKEYGPALQKLAEN